MPERLKHGFYEEDWGYGLYENGFKLAWISPEAYRHIKKHTNVATPRAALEWALKIAGHYVSREHWGSSTLHREDA